MGWSPFVNTGVDNLSRMRFNEALDWAISKLQGSSKTKLDYSLTVKFFKAAAKKLHLDQALVTGIKRQHIKLLLDRVKSDRKWSNNACNKNLGYLGSVLSRLVEYEVIEFNPAHKIKRLPVAETMKYEPLTEVIRLLSRSFAPGSSFFLHVSDGDLSYWHQAKRSIGIEGIRY